MQTCWDLYLIPFPFIPERRINHTVNQSISFLDTLPPNYGQDFSCGRRTVSCSRAKLSAASVNMVELLANWVSQGFISPGQGMEELLEVLATLCDADIDSDSSDEED